MSVFAWLDTDEQERRRMLELVGLFREPGTVDELGIGTIRDALEDTPRVPRPCTPGRDTCCSSPGSTSE